MATFWEIAARSVGHMFPLSFVYLYCFYLFPILILRGEFGFRLLQFLFIAFLKLLLLFSMLAYLFNISCLFIVSSYNMYKRTTADIEVEVVHVKLV